MLILGIETSCDETAVAIVSSEKQILANEIYSQIKEHQKFGGVVPEIAARNHAEILPYIFNEALRKAAVKLHEIDAVAVTGGPGLIGGVMVGVIFAKTIASIIKKPFIAVNHLEGHALTVRLVQNVDFPYLLLLASGGHCQFLLAKGVGNYEKISSTIDDAAGEAFDKVAKMLHLEYPGGPMIEHLAKSGNARFELPKPLCEANRLDMSFSGLKTAVRNLIAKEDLQQANMLNDICASFQKTVADVFVYKTAQVMKLIEQQNIRNFVIAGGVASNQYIKNALQKNLVQYNCNFLCAPSNLCTDNAAMIAWAGYECLQNGLVSRLDFEPKSKWSLS